MTSFALPRRRMIQAWTLPLVLPALLVVIGLGMWLSGSVTGPRRHGLFLGHHALRSGLPSLYFLAYGIITALAALRGRRWLDASGTAALAVGLAALLFVALYPDPVSTDPTPVQKLAGLVPRGLVGWIGVAVGGMLTLPAIGLVTLLQPQVGAVPPILVTNAIGLAGSAVAGCMTGLALALVEARVHRTAARYKGHATWMAFAAMGVWVSTQVPTLPFQVAVAMAALAFHANRVPTLAGNASSRGGGLPVAVCWAVLAYASYVLFASGIGRIATVYVSYVP